MSPDDPQDGDRAGRDPFAEPPGSPAPGEPSSQRYPRAELRRKVSLKFKEFQGFVNEYSENVSAGGMFIRTSSPQPVGTVFDFELTLGDDYTLIHGLGEVVWVRERDEAFDRPPGMGVRFLSLDPGSRKLIDRMVAERLARSGDSAPRPEPHAPPAAAAASGRPDDDAWWGDDEIAPPRTVRVESERLSPVEEPARPRNSGPSPYIYSRSYQGSGFSGDDRGGSRKVLAVLLVLVAVVAAVAAFVLLAPESARRWLPFGGPDDDGLVARQPDDAAGPAARPVEPVAPEDARPLPPPSEDGTDPGARAAGEPETGDAAAGAAEEAGDGERGFFESERPEPAPEPAPAEPAVPAEPAAPAGGPVSRVLNVVWEERGDATLVTIHLDGSIEEWSYSAVRLGDPPRELIRIDGIRRPFPRPTIPVGTALVDQVRLGFHPEGRTSQMHVVVDLADPAARLDRSEATGTELRLWITPGDG